MPDAPATPAVPSLLDALAAAEARAEAAEKQYRDQCAGTTSMIERSQSHKSRADALAVRCAGLEKALRYVIKESDEADVVSVATRAMEAP